MTTLDAIIAEGNLQLLHDYTLDEGKEREAYYIRLHLMWENNLYFAKAFKYGYLNTIKYMLANNYLNFCLLDFYNQVAVDNGQLEVIKLLDLDDTVDLNRAAIKRYYQVLLHYQDRKSYGNFALFCGKCLGYGCMEIYDYIMRFDNRECVLRHALDLAIDHNQQHVWRRILREATVNELTNLTVNTNDWRYERVLNDRTDLTDWEKSLVLMYWNR